MTKTFEVYLISCSASGKKYVGVTTKGFKNRFANHVWHARKSSGSCRALYSAMRKHGASSFGVSLLEVCESFESMNEREIYWIDKLGTLSPNGYNLTRGGDAGTFSEETRLIMSERLKGKPLPSNNVDGLVRAWADPEIRKARIDKIKKAMNRPEVREKTGARQRGVPKSERHIKALREKRARPVRCVDTGQVFEAMVDAVIWVRESTDFKKASHAKIIRATKRADFTAYGYRWERADDA